ncbi:MAG: LysM peptidoglycan-binding domain-containing protein, partial [Chloroflexi bacterium]|nr:LysM peptidoglycan-binding domain-containing protein [Chloroflexota bacterium]
MVCYACRRAAENECGQCGRTYCGRHGAAVCAVCSSPASTAPSPLVFRTTVGASAALLLLAGVFLMWWPTAPAGERRTFLVSDIPAPPRPPTSSLEAAGGPTPSPTARAVTPTPQPPLTYTIVAGDTPGEIASRLGVSVDELLRANGIADPSLIQIGQQLKVPAPAAPSATATAPPAGVRTYTIAAGDTPLDIAARFGVTAEALLRANGITDPSLIQIGQVLTIPAPPGAPTAAPPMTATATPAPTGPAATPTAASASPTPTATPSPQPTPTATPTQAPSGSRTYTIVAGDTPIDIAARFGITVEELLRANGVTDPSLLQIGQVLTIPTPGAAAPTASPTPTPAATVTPAPQATPTPTSAAGGQRTYTIVAG